MSETVAARRQEYEPHFKTAYYLIGAAVGVMLVSFLLVCYDVVSFAPAVGTRNFSQNFGDKLQFTLKYQTLLVAWMVFNVMATIFVRIKNMAVNPLDDEPEKIVIPMRMILTNSLESIFISSLSQMIYITFVSTESVLKYIPLVNLLQFIGRIAFMYGYPMKRAFGYWLTLWPNLILNVINIYYLLIYILYQ